ncbi:MAG: hypothetical protein ACI8Y7_000034 [Candidatus Woesearchaeota archaeon]|jgi:hypothetical protein
MNLASRFVRDFQTAFSGKIPSDPLFVNATQPSFGKLDVALLDDLGVDCQIDTLA